MKSKHLELLENLLKQKDELKYKDYRKLDALERRTTLIINKIFGSKSDYHGDLKEISFTPLVRYSEMPESSYIESWNSGKARYANLVETMIEDLRLSDIDSKTMNDKKTYNSKKLNKEIFVVHGHNEEMKQSVARIIEKLDLVPIILHEQPNKGKTIIEKFFEYSNVSFAIVLLSADDFAYSVKDKARNKKYRARQNVIFELGFFLGKIGRGKVLVLHEEINNLEIPSDYQGVLFVPYDEKGIWKIDLVKEMKACGFNLDANKIL